MAERLIGTSWSGTVHAYAPGSDQLSSGQRRARCRRDIYIDPVDDGRDIYISPTERRVRFRLEREGSLRESDICRTCLPAVRKEIKIQ